MSACNHKELDDEGEVMQFSSVPIEIGQADGSDLFDSRTRSQITIDSENFVCAYLFAFDATTKKILSYPTEWEDHQGEQGGPVAKYTESKTFNWALPLNKNFDVWVIVNPGENIQPLLDSHLSNSYLEEDDLYDTSLVFTCESSSALKDLDVATGGTGIPMAGQMNNQRLTSVNDGLTITVKRLFAKYNIRFDASAYEDEGYTVNMFSIRGSKSNTEVPFFYDGNFAQTDRSKMNVLDYGTSNDLVELNNGEYVTLYFLENCQGTKSGVRDWNTVYDDLNASDPTLDLCSYIEVAVNVTRPAGDGYLATDESFIHRIYVGETFLNKTAHTYNFDVKRNLFQAVKIYLKPSTPDNPDPGIVSEVFKFTNTNSLSVEPGESITVPFVCKGITNDELEFDSSNPQKLEVTGHTYSSTPTIFNGVTYPVSGTVTYRASSDANGSSLSITGGKNLGSDNEVYDTESVDISSPIIMQLSIQWSILSADENGYPSLFFRTVGDNSFSGTIGFYFNLELTYGTGHTPVDPGFYMMLNSGNTNYPFVSGNVGEVYVSFTNGRAVVPICWDASVYGYSGNFNKYELHTEYCGLDPGGITPNNYSVLSVAPEIGDIQTYNYN